MSAEIVVLETDRSVVIADVIETLEKALAQARTGDIAAVALAVVRPDGSVSTSRSRSDDVGRLLGALAERRASQSLLPELGAP